MGGIDVDCCLFDTPVGRCAIAWNGARVAALQLPEADDAATVARMRRRFATVREAAPTDAVAAAIGAIGRLLEGHPDDLRTIAIDDASLPAFHRRVYAAARAIAPGTTRTYGEVAALVGEPGAARAVGHALGRNPFAIIVPCHRVLASGGAMGGFSAAGGTATKRRLLLIEGARSTRGPDLFDR